MLAHITFALAVAADSCVDGIDGVPQPWNGWTGKCAELLRKTEFAECDGTTWADDGQQYPVLDLCSKSCSEKGIDAPGCPRSEPEIPTGPNCQSYVSKMIGVTNEACEAECAETDQCTRITDQTGKTDACYGKWVYGYDEEFGYLDDYENRWGNHFHWTVEMEEYATAMECQTICQEDEGCGFFAFRAVAQPGTKYAISGAPLCVMKTRESVVLANEEPVPLSDWSAASSDPRRNHCNMNLGFDCNTPNHYECKNCYGTAVCAWKSVHHVSGPKYCGHDSWMEEMDSCPDAPAPTVAPTDAPAVTTAPAGDVTTAPAVTTAPPSEGCEDGLPGVPAPWNGWSGKCQENAQSSCTGQLWADNGQGYDVADICAKTCNDKGFTTRCTETTAAPTTSTSTPRHPPTRPTTSTTTTTTPVPPTTLATTEAPTTKPTTTESTTEGGSPIDFIIATPPTQRPELDHAAPVAGYFGFW